MARTTPEQVEGIIDVGAGSDLTPFIESANVLVEEVCVPLGYSDVQLEVIERWLAAHFYAIFDGQVTTVRAGSAGASFQYAIDLGLNCTMWGQQALRFDTLGGLAALNNSAQVKRKIKARIDYLGRVARSGVSDSLLPNWYY